MKKTIIFLLIAFAVAGCDFDSRKFESAQHILPSSKYEWHRFDSTLLYK